MKDKLKRFTMSVAEIFGDFCIFLFILFFFVEFVDTRVLIFQVIAVIWLLVFFVSTVVGIVFNLVELVQKVRKCITKKAAAVLDPDELQQ